MWGGARWRRPPWTSTTVGPEAAREFYTQGKTAYVAP